MLPRKCGSNDALGAALMSSIGYDPAAAVRALRKSDPRMARLIAEIGPCRIERNRPVSPFPALLRAIVYQQLAGKAAATIHGRVLDLFPGRGHPSAADLLAASPDELRGAGLSRNKLAAIQDLARHVEEGRIPTLATLRRWDDDRIIERLTEVRGIGRWTVEMLLIFNLGRPDILPLNDLGILKGFERLSGSRDPRLLAEHGEHWRPWRSVASWYLWRAADITN